MGAARKLKQSNEALSGIVSHGHFLGDETLSWIAQNEQIQKIINDTIINDRLRSFRDSYRDFHRKCELAKRKGNVAQLTDLHQNWAVTLLSYLGYRDFEPRTFQHWEAGQVPYYGPSGDTHSVALFFSFSRESVHSAFESTGFLTTKEGQVSTESSLRESLCEQVEKALRSCGQPEAVLFLPDAAYYFRSDSKISGQCLEIRWDQILMDDNDRSLGLATYFLRQEFFSYQLDASEDTSEAESEDTEDEDETSGSSGGSLRLTESSSIFKEDLEQSRKITEELHEQVVLALELLVNERLHVDADLHKEARKKTHNEAIAADLFKDGLFVLYRVLFVLYAESREYLPVHNRQFASFYSLEHLRDWAENYLKQRNRGLGNPEGTYLWGALSAIFTLLRRGVELMGGEQVSPFNGQLFAPDRAPLFDEGPALRDDAMAKVLTTLTRVGGEESGRRLHFSNLGIEQLGAVYEALLAQKPVVVREPSTWVPAHGGGVGLVSEALAESLDMERFDQDAASARQKRRYKKSKKSLDSFIKPERPGFQPSIGTFIVAPLGGQRRQTASFYTPPKLAEFLVKRTLRPLVEGKTAKDILNLRIIEPAMGSGGFLIAVVRYMAEHLLTAKVRERALHLRTGDRPTLVDRQRCKREVVENCIFGVDINPLAIELARTSLYLEALVPGEPLPFLHHRLRSGNSLIGADFLNRATSSWSQGEDFPMIFDMPIDHIKLDKQLLAAWDGAFGDKKTSESIAQAWKERIAELKKERKEIGSERWCLWANEHFHNISQFLQLARKAQEDFEQVQNSDEIIEAMDARYQDHLALIPDMDPVLIEAYGIEVDEKLVKKRKKTLLNEYGVKRYSRLVEHQRAFTRLKALGDLHCALWYWPLDKAKHFPSFATYHELCSWLLDEKGLTPKSRQQALSKDAFRSLLVALRVARQQGFFHWEIEFAPVFADHNRGGFDGLVSNPPWKIVGVKDKEVYPQFDPQFMKTKPAQKKKRLEKLQEALPHSALGWFEESFRTGRQTDHWRGGKLSEIPPEGKVDLAVLFTLRSERLLRDKGCTGMILSRPSLFVNKASKNLRERFFSEWGLRESVSFNNFLTIFEIHRQFEFALVIGQHGVKPKASRFVHGVVDPNTLDVVSRNLDVADVKSVTSGPKPAELNIEMIGKYFSKENLSIPGITDPRQVEIAEALHRASGPVVYLDELDVVVRVGIDQTAGPKKGLSEYTENIPPEELPKWEDVLAGKVGKWVPLYRGRNFDLMMPATSECFTDRPFNQYARPNVLEELGVDLSKPTLVWRDITQSGNQRTLVACTVPEGCWADNTVWCAQIADERLMLQTLAVFSSMCADFLIKLIASTHVNLGVINSIPIPTYESKALLQATDILKSFLAYSSSSLSSRFRVASSPPEKRLLARFEALMWIHFGKGVYPLDLGNLDWMISTQFDCLARHDPDFRELVLNEYKDSLGLC